MKRNRILWVLAAVCWFQSCDFARATTIVDTGPGPNAPNGYSGTLYNQQWMAAAFTITNSITVTDVQGWISAETSGGNLTIGLYTAGDSVPGSMVASTTLYVTMNAFANWVGQSALNWTLGPGTYWVSFEVHTGSTFWGSMPVPSPSPLFLDGFYYLPFGHWDGGPYTNCLNCSYGIRIYGDVIAQPTYPVIHNTKLLTTGTPDGLRFDISWPVLGSVVIEGCSNLLDSDWQAVQTNILSNGSSSFIDSSWTNFPIRLYRVRSQ